MNHPVFTSDMSVLRPVETKQAPAAIGPYSQAIVYGGLVFTAGQIPLDPETGEMIGGDIRVQTARVLTNLEAVLHQAGASLSSVIKTTVFLRDMDDFAVMNEVYASRFAGHRPARSAVQAARLPRDARIEIEVIAAVGETAAEGALPPTAAA
jgi:2-iminobutanoate/2-iminopropanoate deaminase